MNQGDRRKMTQGRKCTKEGGREVIQGSKWT
jgi:hypothetical protein